jgi:RNA polymerase sigma-54 factor
MLNQKLQQKLLQKLSPQQIMLMKLLQVPTMALEQRIKQEIEENPALEELTDSEDDSQQDESISDNEGDDEELNPEDVSNPDEEFDLSDYMDDDEYIPSYKLSANNTSSDDEHKQAPFVSGTSFHEFLHSQLGLRDLTDHQMTIAQTIIGNLDDAGYLQRDIGAMVDDLAFSQNIMTNKEEIADVLKIVQALDPPGVGARDLKECLVLQLKKSEQTASVINAIMLLEKHFNEFIKKHYDKILKKTRITEDELKQAIDEIIKLNPKPGGSVGETERSNHYVIPDFIIYNNDGGLELSLNNRFTPELRVNRTYADMLESFSEGRSNNNSKRKEAVMFIKQKIDSARWFIDAIRQRQNTLLVTMEAIMDYQKEYFIEGDETLLKPMILKDIAERVNLDISTVSRVANSKYVQTPFGTFLLKSFFSESMQTDSGEEVSTREIKKILSNCIVAEDKSKPLTDDQLTEILKEKGYSIARRTVAKYREQLKIPVARLRKEL